MNPYTNASIDANQIIIKDRTPFTPSEERYTNTTLSETGCYAELSNATDCEEFREIILAKVNRMGFLHFSFVRLNNSDCDPGKLTTIPEKLSKAYYDQQLFKHDLLLSYAMHNLNPIYRSDIDHHAFLNRPFKTDESIANHDIYTLNKSFGLYDYYCVFTKSHNGYGNAMLSISTEDMDPIDFRRNISGCAIALQLLCEATDYIAVHKFPDDFISPMESRDVKINPRPLAVLDALANSDLTVQEVAKKLFISTNTVNQHLIATKQALGVNTNIGAIKKAILKGLITYKK